MADSQDPAGSAPSERDQARYDANIPQLSPETRDVLEKYSKIPPDQIDSHISAIRDKAWAVHPYPCIGQWRFLDLSIGTHKLYSEILTRLRTGNEIYLDLGCAFAQDIRRLVADGVDSGKCYASDLQLDFIELGYELFRDKETLKTQFVAADIFDAESALKELEGRVDVIGASSFFHLFSWEDQKTIGLRVARLLKPEKDSLVVGRQVGNANSGDREGRDGSAGLRFRHNPESWKQLWHEIGEELGVKYEVETRPWNIYRTSTDPGHLGMEFSVRRL